MSAGPIVTATVMESTSATERPMAQIATVEGFDTAVDGLLNHRFVVGFDTAVDGLLNHQVLGDVVG